MSYDEDMDVFFQLGDPGIVEVTYIDEESKRHTLNAELITNTQRHESGNKHINQDNPALKTSESLARFIHQGNTVFLDDVKYRVNEKKTVSIGIVMMYLGKKSQGGDHRWQ